MTLDKKTILSFLETLARNNSKTWMDEHRDEYHHAKAVFVEVIDEIIRQVKLIDPDFVDLPAKKALLRINRNLLYSKDKTPYKDYFGASIIKEQGKSDFYIHVSPQECFVAGGFYHPTNEILSYIRQEIDYEADRFMTIINQETFKADFDQPMMNHRLKTSPKGYKNDNHMIKYVRLKSYVVSHPVSIDEFLDDNYVNKVVRLYRSMLPFRKFLDRALVEYRESA